VCSRRNSVEVVPVPGHEMRSFYVGELSIIVGLEFELVSNIHEICGLSIWSV
jgi:hypothetical protein